MRDAKRTIRKGIIKKGVAFCLAVVIALGVAACGGNGKTGKEAPAKSDTAPTAANNSTESKEKKSAEITAKPRQTETKKENSSKKGTGKEDALSKGSAKRNQS